MVEIFVKQISKNLLDAQDTMLLSSSYNFYQKPCKLGLTNLMKVYFYLKAHNGNISDNSLV